MIIANTVRTEEASAQSYLTQHPEISCPVTLHDKSELPMPFSDTSGIPHNFFVSPDGTLKFSKAGVRRPDEIKLIMQAAWKQE
jgi:hypothetical protein